MRRLAVVLLILMALAVQAPAITQSYTGTISATDVNTARVFVDNGTGGSNQTFYATTVLVINDGTDEVYVNWRTTVAATSDIQVKASESIELHSRSDPGVQGIGGIGLICASGETASVRVTALR